MAAKIKGTGLFVGSGQALANGGPASIVICYCLVGIMLYTTVHADTSAETHCM